jgi:hypothetical protein
MSVKKGTIGDDLMSELSADWYTKYKGGHSSGPGVRPNLAADIADPDYACMMWTGVISDAGPIPSNYSGYIIFLNEPDSEDQADVTPEDAIDLLVLARAEWTSAKFIFGNVMSLTGTGVGKEWVQDAIDYCEAQSITKPERWGVHVYGIYADKQSAGDHSFQDCLETLIAIHDIVDVPIWVTETGNQPGLLGLFRLQLDTWDSLSWVERFAVFPGYKEYENPYENEDLYFADLWGRLIFKASTTISASATDNSYNSSASEFDDPPTPALSAGDRLWVVGFTDDKNNGFKHVVSVTASKVVVEEDLATEAAGDSIYMYQNGWSLDMRVWDRTGDVITPMGQIMKDFTEDGNVIHLFEEPIAVVSDGDYATDFDWTELDLSSHIPSGSQGVFIRCTAKCANEHVSGYISFAGESDLASNMLTLRARDTDGSWDEATGVVKTNSTDSQSIYWKVNVDNLWSDVYVLVLGYIL